MWFFLILGSDEPAKKMNNVFNHEEHSPHPVVYNNLWFHFFIGLAVKVLFVVPSSLISLKETVKDFWA